jgi:mannose-1-phosphate guanylyltransferase / mannose-6-phosphate isomerase
MQEHVVPAIMSGGSGSRLWPLSRQTHPKQFLPLTGEATLLQQTAMRCRPDTDIGFTPPLVIGAIGQTAQVAQQLDAVDLAGGLILGEPAPRNTAAAVAAIALAAEAEYGPDALVLVMPSDNHIVDTAAFRTSIGIGLALARQGRIVTLGITPRSPETGYGYIQAGTPFPSGGAAISAFREKPKLDAAQAMLAEGGWMWNAGLFLFRVRDCLQEMERHCADVLTPVRAAVAAASVEGRVWGLGAADFAKATSMPFDTAVMERTANGAVVPVECGWDDVGSYAALWQLSAKDSRGNAVSGDHPVTLIDTDNLFVQANGVSVSAAGLKDLIIVATPEAVLVVHRDDSQRVKEVVEALKRGGHATLL